MDWYQEISKSLIWLAKAYSISLIGFVIIGFIIVKYSKWGRQFWRIGGHFFSPKRSWKPLIVCALLLFFALFSVRMSVLFSFWYNGFYSALQALDEKAFWFFLVIFGILATIHVVMTLLNAYIGQSFDIHWRNWLNKKITSDWLTKESYYREQFLKDSIDNPDQRIERDIAVFVTISRSLSIGALSSFVSLVAFTGILWSLSGPLNIVGVEVPRAMVFLVYIYVLIATLIAFKIGRPLILLNFLNEKLSANYRYALMRVREYAENIAFYRGDEVEKKTLFTRFAAVISNAWAMVFRGLKFDGFNLTISQIAVIFPFILQAPRFFSGAIKLGDVMQTATAFGQVQDALSFFRSSYDTFAQYRAVLDRLTGFLDANSNARELPQIKTTENKNNLIIHELNVTRPDGSPLTSNLNVSLVQGESLLIKGPSGSGKTTLLRTIAQLWPYATGKVERAIGDETIFLSQRPYLPLGELRAAIAYPDVVTPADDEKITAILSQVNLAHLSSHLGESHDWSRILSIGEQQRLAFARVLFNKPRLIFLDEATSATDEGLEYTLYNLVKNELPQSIMVSVGHRSTLDKFHSHLLAITGKGDWELKR